MRRVFWALVSTLLLLGCDDGDVGRCCEVVGGDDSIVPVSEQDESGRFINDVARDPAFDCNSLTCVAFQGSQAYCTERCRDAADCPDGFACQPVIQSEPAPGGTLGPDDRFCVKDTIGATCE